MKRMKKGKRLWRLAVLALPLFLGGCGNSDDLGGDHQGEIILEGEKIEPAKVDVAVESFFEAAFLEAELSYSATFKGFPDSHENHDDVCAVINSERDFANFYGGSLNIPDIDYSQYTLVVCRVELPSANFCVETMEIVRNSNHTPKLIVNVGVCNDDCVIGACVDRYYWNLFPRFGGKELTIVKNLN